MHSMEAGTYTDTHTSPTPPGKWGTVRKIVREANVGFPALSSEFVRDDLIRSTKEEGKIPIIQDILFSR